MLSVRSIDFYVADWRLTLSPVVIYVKVYKTWYASDIAPLEALKAVFILCNVKFLISILTRKMVDFHIPTIVEAKKGVIQALFLTKTVNNRLFVD